MGGVKGDFDQLRKLANKLRALGPIAEDTAKLAAPRVSDALAGAFDASTDPYGNPWPLNKDGSLRRLNDSGALRASVTQLSPDGKRLKGTMVPYGRYQNPRLFLPSSRRAPDSVRRAIDESALEALRKHFGVRS